MSTSPSRDRDLLLLVAGLAKSLRCWQQDEVFCQGVTFSQFHILDAVAQKDRLPLSDLHEILGVEKSTTTRLIYPLEKVGLISREKSDGDLRAYNLRLTHSGRRTYQKIRSFQSKLFESLEGLIPKRDREAIYRAVKMFSHALRHCCVPGCTAEEGISKKIRSNGRRHGKTER